MDCDVTYEELAAYASGDLDQERQAEIRGHLARCTRCRKRLAALADADTALKALPPVRAPGWAILDTRRALAAEIRSVVSPEIMTLEETAEFLRITPEELGEIVEELPAFELAGRIRVRRERLIEWISRREREYTRRTAAGWSARVTSSEFNLNMGVAS